MDSVIDRFGENMQTEEYDDDRFSLEVEIAVNNVFYSWVFGFGGKVEIESPLEVKTGYEDMVKRAAALLDPHENNPT